jgi:hypothetical protein
MATGSEEVVAKLIGNDELMAKILKYVKLSNVPTITKEIYWILSNMTRKANIETLNVLVNQGLLELYVEKLNTANNSTDTDTLIQIMKSIKKILKKGKAA